MTVQVYVRGSNRATLGLLTDWSSLTLLQRRNDVGKWLLTTASKADADLLAAGTGVVIRRDGVTLASGWRWPDYQVQAQGAQIEWQIGGWDDTILLHDTLCWPSPTQPITAQPDRDHAVTGSASTRVRTYFAANVVTRLAIPGTSAGPVVALGPTGTSHARFTQLLELAREVCGTAVNFRVVQEGTTLTLGFTTPRDLTLAVQFSPEVGTVRSWGYNDAGPEVTRVIVGAGGEGAARKFRQRTASLAGSRESDWANVRKVEQFRDARDVDIAVTGWEAEADARGDETLLEGRRKQSFSLDVADTPGQRYGVDFLVGDLVRAYAVPGVPIDELVEQVEATLSADGGERTKVWVGPVDDPDEYDADLERQTRNRIARLERAL